jgi:hypothetical protein
MAWPARTIKRYNSKNGLLFGKFYWKRYMAMSEVDAVMYVLLSKTEKHVPYGELVGIISCLML